MRMNAATMRQQKTAPHILGPHNSDPSTNGFHDHCNLPTGGGKNGLVFGSLRAVPAGKSIAYAHTSTAILTSTATATATATASYYYNSKFIYTVRLLLLVLLVLVLVLVVVSCDDDVTTCISYVPCLLAKFE